jgi:hypothetical protein
MKQRDKACKLSSFNYSDKNIMQLTFLFVILYTLYLYLSGIIKRLMKKYLPLFPSRLSFSKKLIRDL